MEVQTGSVGRFTSFTVDLTRAQEMSQVDEDIKCKLIFDLSCFGSV